VKMVARLIDDPVQWDRFIDDSADSTLFHKWDFLRIMERYTGYKLLPYGIYRDDDLVAAIPLFYNKTCGLKLLYSPPPTSMVYVPYLGLATAPWIKELRPREKEEAWSFIIGELGGLVGHISPNYVTIGLLPGVGDSRPFIWNDFEAELKYTYTFDLEQPLETLWDRMEKNCKKEIREASKSPLTLERAYDADMFSDIMRNGLKKAGKTFYHRQSPQYIKDVLQAFPGNIRMYFLYNGDDVASAAVNYGFHGRFMGWMGNTVVDNGLSANQYMIWEFLKQAKSEGYGVYENIGADEKRLNLAKTKFNPDLTPYFQIMKRDLVYRTAKYGMAKLEKAIGS
jgi:hypothetical protein